MDSAQRELLARIEAFQLDRPDARLIFSARLAKDQGWSLDFTHRAIREYRRFAFLAVAAGHPVAPSDQIDQVWHEHLTYTRSYWEEFCGQVLCIPLHHEPTRGGAEEARKFDDWYSRTLASYRRFFGEEPPSDLWPAPVVRFAPDVHFSRIDTARHWIIPKPRWLRPLLSAAAAAGAGLLIAGCASALAAGLGPLDYRGPEFLSFFWILALGIFAVAAVWRWKLRAASAVNRGEPAPDDPYSIALLNGGRTLAVHAAIARLVQEHHLIADPTAGRLSAKKKLPPNATELEQVIVERVQGLGNAKPAELVSYSTPALLRLEDGLKAAGLLTDRQASTARWGPFMLCAAVVVFGLIKVFVGLERGKPVLFLVVSCIVLAVVALIGFGRKVWRTPAGDAHLRNLRAEHSIYQRGRPSGFALPLAVGLFGYAILENTEAAHLRRMLQPTSGDGSSSSGCSSSDGGGGGDSGGGGSGCGGCGGGGGGD